MSATPQAPSLLNTRLITEIVCDHYQVRLADVLSSRRTHEIIRPRHVAMYLAQRLTLASLPQIGRKMGGRDHTTVLHAVRKVEQDRGTDAGLNADLEALEAEIRATAGVFEELGRTAPGERDPLALAQSILDDPRRLTGVAVEEVELLASAVLQCHAEVGAAQAERDRVTRLLRRRVGTGRTLLERVALSFAEASRRKAAAADREAQLVAHLDLAESYRELLIIAARAAPEDIHPQQEGQNP